MAVLVSKYVAANQDSRLMSTSGSSAADPGNHWGNGATIGLRLQHDLTFWAPDTQKRVVRIMTRKLQQGTWASVLARKAAA